MNDKVWIQTWSGRRFDLINPDPEMVHLRDIAEALAKANRFTGHTSRPYSVAQHSIFCSHHTTMRARLPALLHDAEEAYTGDMSTPMKMAMRAAGAGDAYHTIADGIRGAIFRRFGLSFPVDPDVWMEVKNADALALSTERRDLMRVQRKDWTWPLPDPDPVLLVPMPWWDAAEQFMKRAKELGCRE